MNILRQADQVRSKGGTLTYEGADHGGGASFFLVNAAPGMTVAQHWHPYAETWIVRGGLGEITIGGETDTIGPGDIVVAPANTPHGFTALGPDRLDIICIHASDKIIQTWL